VIRERQIDILHAQSRAASWVSYFAAKTCNIPLVSTIHGRQHIHLSSRTFNIYGEKIICVCENIYDQLINDLRFDPSKLVVIRNGIDTDVWSEERIKQVSHHEKIISIVGRISGPKGDVVRKLLSTIFPTVIKIDPSVKLQIVGGMKEANEFERYLDTEVDPDVRSKTSFLGYTDQIKEVYRQSTVV